MALADAFQSRFKGQIYKTECLWREKCVGVQTGFKPGVIFCFDITALFQDFEVDYIYKIVDVLLAACRDGGVCFK